MTDTDPPTSTPAVEEREDDGAPGEMRVVCLRFRRGVYWQVATWVVVCTVLVFVETTP